MNINELQVKDEYKHFIPRPSSEDYNRIKESIAKKGIKDALTINQSKTIIDGYTRYGIAQELNITDVPVEQKTFSDEIEEQEFIIQKNFHRRQLNNAQKAEIGLKIKKFEETKAKQRRDRTDSKNKKTGRFTSGGNISTTEEKGKSRDKAAQQVGISGRTLDKAKHIKEFIEEHDDDDGEDVQKLWDEAISNNNTISSVYDEIQRLKFSGNINNQKRVSNDVVVLDNFICPVSKKTLQIICRKTADLYEDGTEENIKYNHIIREQLHKQKNN